MKLESSFVRILTISDVPSLDPIRVVVENYSPGRGRIIIQCYDRAWVGYWGGMGAHSLEDFFVSCDADYIAGNLTCGLHGMRKDAAKHAEPYLRRIIGAVQDAFIKEAAGAVAAEKIECWSRDEENFNARTLGELLESHDDLKVGDVVWIGDGVPPSTGQLIDADDVIDQLGDRACDIAGEHADSYPDVSPEHKAQLDAILAQWITHACPPTFWNVTNIRAYTLTGADFDMQAEGA